MARTVTATDRSIHADAAYGYLRMALRHARLAGARQLVPKIRYALKSAEGAKRHATLRILR